MSNANTLRYVNRRMASATYSKAIEKAQEDFLVACGWTRLNKYDWEAPANDSVLAKLGTTSLGIALRFTYLNDEPWAADDIWKAVFRDESPLEVWKRTYGSDDWHEYEDLDVFEKAIESSEILKLPGITEEEVLKVVLQLITDASPEDDSV